MWRSPKGSPIANHAEKTMPISTIFIHQCFISAFPLPHRSRQSVVIPLGTHEHRRFYDRKAAHTISYSTVRAAASSSPPSSSSAPSPSTYAGSQNAAFQADSQPHYVPLHVHSDFSLLDGASQLPSLVKRAQELEVPALALTDHGVLYGAVQLVRLCANTSVKPIIGNEMYLVNSELPLALGEDGKPSKIKLKRYHLIVLAKNTIGYRNLVKLTSMAHLDGRVGTGIFARPCINKTQLYNHREGLIVCSACLGGEIPQAILNNDINAARTVATWYRDTFGSDFYLEVQDHGSKEDRIVNPVIVQLGKELNIPVIATNDSHFTSCLDAEAHDAMICIQTGKRLSDENRLHYAGNEYFKSFDEMRECFVDHLPPEAIEDALQNTLQVAAKVESYDLFGETRIPDFPTPTAFENSHDNYLRQVAREGLEGRLNSRLNSGLLRKRSSTSKDSNATVIQTYQQRLEEELDMICRMGFASYFLVVWDYIKHAREMDIPVGPGRGSAAGCLVAFALRITDVDPIEFNLLFERFLNPERKSMPDIDTDFSVEGRERVIAYVTERYGHDRVAQIITFNRLTSKAVLKDVARVHEVPYAEADRLAKMIPVVRGKPATLSQLLGDKTPSPDFKRTVQRNPEYSIWLDKAQRIEGANKTYGIHAAGVVISATSLDSIVPLSRAKHGETITQYAMEDVEALGLLKMDFLGLKNLSVIETALRFINEGRRMAGQEKKLDFSVDHLPLDDANTYRLLAQGELDGIFQLDASAGMRAIVRELQPSSLEDVSSILALYRPGPLDAGLIPKFIRRKHGAEPIEYDHPLLEPILKETYGIMVYQEQIMRIARDLAGYSLGQADILRRAMGKKKMKDMEREKPKFVDGAIKNGVPRETATNLFDQMVKFAEYCFNKSHSTAYAYLTYQTAFLKANYPVEYCAALLRSNMNQSDKLVRYLADANASGVSVLPPSVNRSDIGFTVSWDGERHGRSKKAVVLFGLEAVKTVGDSVGSALIAERNENGAFHNIIDLIERVDLRVLNKRAMGALIKAGAFDELHPNRKVLLEYLEEMLVLRRKLRDKRRRREAKGPLSSDVDDQLKQDEQNAWEDIKFKLESDSVERADFSTMERLGGEKSTLGFYASGHPLYELQHIEKILNCTRVVNIVGESQAQDDEFEQLQNDNSNRSVIADGTEVMILSCVTELKRLTTAKGKKMGKWMIEDVSGRLPAIVFPEAYELLEQVVDQVDSASGSESEQQEPSYIVEEDARVIVWGKVDRESSGSAQIIVDDVQRVEDVSVFMATAKYSEYSTPSSDLHILKHMAAKLLDIELGDMTSLTFVDPNGIRRRRRRRTTPLAEKSRVPLILQSLGPDGRPRQYYNAGNAVRFPRNCAEYIEPLEKNTGCWCRLLSVGHDMLNKEFDEQVDNNVQYESSLLAEKDKPSSLKTLDEENETVLKERGLTLSEQIQVHNSDMPTFSALGVGSTELSSLEKEHIEMVSESLKAMQVDEEQLLALMNNGYDDNGRFNEMQSNGNPARNENIDRGADNKIDGIRENEMVDGTKGSAGSRYPHHISRDPTMSRRFSENHAVQNFLSHEAFRRDSEIDQSHRTTTVAAALTAVPTQRKISVQHHISNGSSTISPDNKNRDIAGREYRSGNLGLPRKPNKLSFETSEGEELSENGTLVIIPNIPNTFGEKTRMKAELEEIDQPIQCAVEANGMEIADINMNKNQTTAGSQTSNLALPKTVVAQKVFKSKLQLTNERGRAGTVNVPMTETQVDPIEHNVPLIPKVERDQLNFVDELMVSTTEYSEAPTIEIERGGLNIVDGLVVRFDEARFGGVLDAIALVAADAASRYFGSDKASRSQFFVIGMSGLSLEKLNEKKVSLKVSANVAYYEDQNVHILADIRETSPTGQRRRVRSFGPVAVIMQSASTVGTEWHTKKLQTKTAKKRLESLVQKLDNTFGDACDSENSSLSTNSAHFDGNGDTPPTDVSSDLRNKTTKGSSTVNVRTSETSFSTCTDMAGTMNSYEGAGFMTLADGGELLLFMSRSAEVCAKRVVGPSNTSWLTKMKWVSVDSSESIKNGTIVSCGQVQRVNMNAQLVDLSFDELRIAVVAEALVLGDGGKELSLRLVGEFGARCADAKFVKKLRVIQDGHSLFSRSKVTQMVKNIARSIETS